MWVARLPGRKNAAYGLALALLLVFSFLATRGPSDHASFSTLGARAVVEHPARVLVARGVKGIASSPVAGPLSVTGARILDAHGQPVAFRGVNSGWLTTRSKGLWDESPLSDRSIGVMRQWGMNIVRVELSEQFWNSDECLHSASYAPTIDRVVRSITGRGMVALLDLHTVTGERCGKAGQLRLADKGSLKFWTEVANRYGTNPLVAFDVFNEPHGVNESMWRNGTPDSDDLGYRGVGMQDLVAAIRSTGAKNLVFVSGNNWGATPPQQLVFGRNLVYAAHSYTCPTEAPPKCSAPQPQVAAPANGARLSAWNELASRSPVVVTEFGWPGSDPSGAFVRSVISWSEQHAQGWIGFDWMAQQDSPRATTGFGLITDFTTMRPNSTGKVILDAMRSYGRPMKPAKQSGRADAVTQVAGPPAR